MKAIASFVLLATWLIILTVGVTSRGYADAVTFSGGHIADGHEPGGVHTGVTAASSETFSDFFSAETDAYHSFATSNSGILRAYAFAHQINPNLTVGGESRASWTDVLTLTNPDVLLNYPTPGNLYVFFSPQADGTGRNATVEFAASITDRGEPVAESDEKVFGEGASPGPLTLDFNGPASSLIDGITFWMELRVRVSVQAPGESGEVDYSHTAFLPPLFIGDVYGNPIPELANVSFNIVGSSGTSYATTTSVPEPPTLALSGIGAIALIAVSQWRRASR